MKTCRICKEEKPETDFHKNKNNKDGLAYQCRPCLRIYHKQHYAFRKNPKRCTVNGCEKIFYPTKRTALICPECHRKNKLISKDLDMEANSFDYQRDHHKSMVWDESCVTV